MGTGLDFDFLNNVSFFEAGAVVVKKMTLNPFLLLLWRDLLRLTTQVQNPDHFKDLKSGIQ